MNRPLPWPPRTDTCAALVTAEIGLPVAVEFADRDRARRLVAREREGRRAGERSVSLPAQHGDRIPVALPRGAATARSSLPSPSKSAAATWRGSAKRREALAGFEGAIALADADVHGVESRVGDREVLPAVAVEVPDGRSLRLGLGAGARPSSMSGAARNGAAAASAGDAAEETPAASRSAAIEIRVRGIRGSS